MTPRRGIAAIITAALASAVIVALVYGRHGGIVTFLILAGAALPVIAGAYALARSRAAIGSLSRQLAAGVALTAGLVMAVLGAAALLMFISPHDALMMALLLFFASVLSAYAASVLARGILDDIGAVRDGVLAVGEGRAEVEIATGGRDEIAELAWAANRMARQLAERERERDSSEAARRDLIAAVSHDLRTPLTSLRLLADAVEDDLVDDATRARYLGEMSVHIRSLSALIEDLFELSRLEAGDIQWSMQQVALDALVAETVEAMRPQAQERHVVVASTVTGGVAPARANPEKLQRVLFNLIQNAIRHTPADGSVTVFAESNGETVEVEVSDTGEGLSVVEQERAFEAFYRGGTGGARSGDGTGLGLTICRAIVEAHGGEIWFADAKQGTRVRFSLPRAA
jgi:signal transduction histidine kinase